MLVAACGIFHCSSQTPQLWHAGSAVVVHGLSCSMACGILVLWPGIWPVSPALPGRFLTSEAAGESLYGSLQKKFAKFWFQESYRKVYLYCFKYIFHFLHVFLLQCGRLGFDPLVGKIPWRRERLPTPLFWPGEFQGLYSPWGLKQSDKIEWLSLLLLMVALVPIPRLSGIWGLVIMIISVIVNILIWGLEWNN